MSSKIHQLTALALASPRRFPSARAAVVARRSVGASEGEEAGAAVGACTCGAQEDQGTDLESQWARACPSSDWGAREEEDTRPAGRSHTPST